jgi:hypothetical protein
LIDNEIKKEYKKKDVHGMKTKTNNPKNCWKEDINKKQSSIENLTPEFFI